jgi:hypothetical protein
MSRVLHNEVGMAVASLGSRTQQVHHNFMGPLSYVWSVPDGNIMMRCMTVILVELKGKASSSLTPSYLVVGFLNSFLPWFWNLFFGLLFSSL